MNKPDILVKKPKEGFLTKKISRSFLVFGLIFLFTACNGQELNGIPTAIPNPFKQCFPTEQLRKMSALPINDRSGLPPEISLSVSSDRATITMHHQPDSKDTVLPSILMNNDRAYNQTSIGNLVIELFFACNRIIYYKSSPVVKRPTPDIKIHIQSD